MKKKTLKTKLILNKKTIVNLNKKDMHTLLGGAQASKIGLTCYTAACCKE